MVNGSEFKQNFEQPKPKEQVFKAEDIDSQVEGFDDRTMADRANAMRADIVRLEADARKDRLEILKQQDRGRAEKLRQELAAYLDDFDQSDTLVKIREKKIPKQSDPEIVEQTDSAEPATGESKLVEPVLEDEIANAEFKKAMALGGYRLVVDQLPGMLQAISAESDPTKADLLRLQVEAFMKGETLKETRELSDMDRARLDKRAAKFLVKAENALAEARKEALETPDDQLTSAEKIGQRNFEAKVKKNYEEAKTELDKLDIDSLVDDRDDDEDEQQVA